MIVSLLFVACTKEGDTIYQPDPDEEQPSTAPLVTVIYGPNSLGDRVYCDKIYKGIEASAAKRGLRTLHLMPESMEQGLTYLEMMFQQMESAQDSVRRLFIATSPSYEEYIRKNNRRLENNPNADCSIWRHQRPWRAKAPRSTSTIMARCIWQDTSARRLTFSTVCCWCWPILTPSR